MIDCKQPRKTEKPRKREKGMKMNKETEKTKVNAEEKSASFWNWNRSGILSYEDSPLPSPSI